ncbi:MAG TPA: transcriptional regulator [Candidatus Bathyarchaeota archaeon]|nr:transcriptional regulator [Candidatus Bathyarchaeota archaeon]
MPYHPRAWLAHKRNVKPGLNARTKIIMALEEEPGLTIAQLSERTGLSYSAIRHHLASLEREGIVARSGRRPFKWALTGLGQARLTEF